MKEQEKQDTAVCCLTVDSLITRCQTTGLTLLAFWVTSHSLFQLSACLFPIPGFVSLVFWILYSSIQDCLSLYIYICYLHTHANIFSNMATVSRYMKNKQLISLTHPISRNSLFLAFAFPSFCLILGVKCFKFCHWLQKKEISFFSVFNVQH